MLRTDALKLYRQILRQAYRLQDKTQREEICSWARDSFELQRHQNDEAYIAHLITKGREDLKQLEAMVKMSTS